MSFISKDLPCFVLTLSRGSDCRSLPQIKLSCPNKRFNKACHMLRGVGGGSQIKYLGLLRFFTVLSYHVSLYRNLGIASGYLPSNKIRHTTKHQLLQLPTWNYYCNVCLLSLWGSLFNVVNTVLCILMRTKAIVLFNYLHQSRLQSSSMIISHSQVYGATVLQFFS